MKSCFFFLAMSATQITVQAVIAAEPRKVWEYYTRPEHITQWNFASDDWHCPRASNEMKVGGRYNARMEARDQSFGFDFEAVYEAVEPGKSFIYKMADGRRASVELAPQDRQTRITVRFDAETENSQEMQKAGWQAILDNFKRYTESHQAGSGQAAP